jgi:DNA-binding transcriptional LysR family regulator
MSDRPSLAELHALSLIVTHKSFRKAADELELSRSTLSHMMLGLEKRVGVRLLNRTTRSVSATEAGAMLIEHLQPIFHQLDIALAQVTANRARPSGTLRINSPESAAHLLMLRVIPSFLREYPEMNLDLVVDGKFIDIVEQNFDAGIRIGDAIAQDMVSVAFSDDTRFVVVATPGYLKGKKRPRVPGDLAHHQCIRSRLPGGKSYRWEFKKAERSIDVDVSGSLVLNNAPLMLAAALQGVGIAYVPERQVRPHLEAGTLVQLLQDWSSTFPGFHLYYPGHRHVSPGLRAFIEVLRREGNTD